MPENYEQGQYVAIIKVNGKEMAHVFSKKDDNVDAMWFYHTKVNPTVETILGVYPLYNHKMHMKSPEAKADILPRVFGANGNMLANIDKKLAQTRGPISVRNTLADMGLLSQDDLDDLENDRTPEMFRKPR